MAVWTRVDAHDISTDCQEWSRVTRTPRLAAHLGRDALTAGTARPPPGRGRPRALPIIDERDRLLSPGPSLRRRTLPRVTWRMDGKGT
jgi:hypothetical protein